MNSGFINGGHKVRRETRKRKVAGVGYEQYILHTCIHFERIKISKGNPGKGDASFGILLSGRREGRDPNDASSSQGPSSYQRQKKNVNRFSLMVLKGNKLC